MIKGKVVGSAERSGQWKTNWPRGTGMYVGQPNFGRQKCP